MFLTELTKKREKEETDTRVHRSMQKQKWVISQSNTNYIKDIHCSYFSSSRMLRTASLVPAPGVAAPCYGLGVSMAVYLGGMLWEVVPEFSKAVIHNNIH